MTPTPPAEKRRQVLDGAAGVITLPNDHRLYVAGRTGEAGVIALRVNRNGAYCWGPSELSEHWLSRVLHRADGNIVVGPAREVWPRDYEEYAHGRGLS